MSPWQHTCMCPISVIMATYCVHHSNIYMCMFTMATYMYACTFHVTMAIYMWQHLCAPWQHNKIQAGRWCTLGPVLCNIAMVTHVSLFTVQLYCVLFGYAHVNIMLLIILTSVSACRWPSWTQEPLNLHGGKTYKQLITWQVVMEFYPPSDTVHQDIFRH